MKVYIANGFKIVSIAALIASLSCTGGPCAPVLAQAPTRHEQSRGKNADDQETLRAITESNREAEARLKIDRIRAEKREQLKAQIGKLSHVDRIRAIKELPDGEYVDLPEFWEIQKNPDTVMTALAEFGDPMTPAMVHALAKVQPRLRDEPQRLQAAAYLYRSGDPLGRSYMLDAMRSRQDLTATWVLAMNHEPECIKTALVIVKNAPDRSGILIRILAAWHSPDVAAGLWEIYANNPHNTLLMLALAAQGDKRMLAYARDIYHKVTDDLDLQIACLAVIDKFDPRSAESRTLLSMLQGGPDHDARTKATAAQALGLAEDLNAKSALEDLLQQCIIAHGQRGIEGIPHNAVVGATAEALSRLHDLKSCEILKQALVRLNGEDITRVYTVQVAGSMMSLGCNTSIIATTLPPKIMERLRLEHGPHPIPSILALGTSAVITYSVAPSDVP